MTINDVAKAAGVSKSTVSRYLNDGYVSKENREKIKEAIDKTGYRSNLFARGLKTNKSQLIAVVLPRLDSFTAVQTLEGINTVFSKFGYQMVVVPKNTIEEDELTYIKKLSAQGFDGVIVVAHAITDEHIQLVKSSPIPILFTGQTHDEANCYALDDYAIGKSVAEYVNTLKPKNVLYLSVSESDVAVGVNRKQGLIDNVKSPVRTLISGFRHEDAYRIMRDESDTIKFDIVIGATDNIAIGAIRYLKERNVIIPDEVKVIGIGDYDLNSMISPALTTLHIDYFAFGKNAAHTMLNLLNVSEDSISDLETIDYNMVIRETTL